MSPLRVHLALLAAALFSALGSPGRANESAATWPSFRGPFASGVADGQNLPFDGRFFL